MIPKPTKNATGNFTAPKGWDDNADGPCGGLSVRVEEVGFRQHYVSTWEPTAKEIEALRLGAHVELRIVGVQPPVLLTVEDIPPESLLVTAARRRRSIKSLKMDHGG